ncbi:MAG: hypothetical protein RM049_27520 [Nostoc sp. DedQUE04]|nr:hypothetical protein [Nostoc sp. DedQUE04]
MRCLTTSRKPPYKLPMRSPQAHLTFLFYETTAPKTRQQLEENLAVLHAPQIEAQEIANWQEYGNLIYGTGQDAFDTQWV